MVLPLTMPLNLALSAITRIDVLLVAQPLQMFAQNASLEHSLAVQVVPSAIIHAFSAVEVPQIAFHVPLENISVKELVNHVLKIVLFARVLLPARNAQKDQFWLEQSVENAQSNAPVVALAILLNVLTAMMACVFRMVHVFHAHQIAYLAILPIFALTARADTN